jgi:hypothetical protein
MEGHAKSPESPALQTAWNGALRAGDPASAYPCGLWRVPGHEPMRVRLPADRLIGLTAPAVEIGNRCHRGNRCHSRIVLASISNLQSDLLIANVHRRVLTSAARCVEMNPALLLRFDLFDE